MQFLTIALILLFHLFTIVSSAATPTGNSPPTIPSPSQQSHSRRTLPSAFTKAVAAGVDPLGAHPADYISANSQYISFAAGSKFELWAAAQLGEEMGKMGLMREGRLWSDRTCAGDGWYYYNARQDTECGRSSKYYGYSMHLTRKEWDRKELLRRKRTPAEACTRKAMC
ncbi:hypothetical protein K440DRAFT_646665 [Wilcoxina mikolae CBS 423.85]|nr:hypothetical protein K440DRAFT_646665 [Wilcoxina mikolae CBS 423.85]